MGISGSPADIVSVVQAELASILPDGAASNAEVAALVSSIEAGLAALASGSTFGLPAASISAVSKPSSAIQTSNKNMPTTTMQITPAKDQTISSTNDELYGNSASAAGNVLPLLTATFPTTSTTSPPLPDKINTTATYEQVSKSGMVLQNSSSTVNSESSPSINPYGDGVQLTSKGVAKPLASTVTGLGYSITPAISNLSIKYEPSGAFGSLPNLAVGSVTSAPYHSITLSMIPVYTPELLGNAYGGGFIITPSIYIAVPPYVTGSTKGIPPGYGSSLISGSPGAPSYDSLSFGNEIKTEGSGGSSTLLVGDFNGTTQKFSLLPSTISNPIETETIFYPILPSDPILGGSDMTDGVGDPANAPPDPPIETTAVLYTATASNGSLMVYFTPTPVLEYEGSAGQHATTLAAVCILGGCVFMPIVLFILLL
ncbi:hypothetical protein MMC12_006787 [Toensbergia leucococca]|nr:hypothetical protein [Toensbergia leucococca]